MDDGRNLIQPAAKAGCRSNRTLANRGAAG